MIYYTFSCLLQVFASYNPSLLLSDRLPTDRTEACLIGDIGKTSFMNKFWSSLIMFFLIRLIGNAAQILGIVAIFFGFEELMAGDDNWVKNLAWYIIIAFIAFHCFTHVILSVIYHLFSHFHEFISYFSISRLLNAPAIENDRTWVILSLWRSSQEAGAPSNRRTKSVIPLVEDFANSCWPCIWYWISALRLYWSSSPYSKGNKSRINGKRGIYPPSGNTINNYYFLSSIKNMQS